ncbi:carbamate kinase [Hyphococcus sp.]|uniref:carbamate kinase n=1 Tax=Hyphococcus sp. TaxID=2038636 RepID=UPI003CCBE318
MLILIALGGNALLKRGEPITSAAQWTNIRNAARAIANVAGEHQLVITHGNGPQAGLLALQAGAYKKAEPYTLDIIGAATAGMIGYMIEQELGNVLGYEVPIATMLTRVCVDADDPAFRNPTKFVGPVYDAQGAQKLEREKGWVFKKDNENWRRVVPSPEPQSIVWHRPIRWLVGQKALLICAGGGGIPVIRHADNGRLEGVEAIIDKDRTSSLLAQELSADLFIIATDVDGVYEGFGTPEQNLIKQTTPNKLEAGSYSSGSMGPKVDAASWFVRETGKRAVIGALDEIETIIGGQSGTSIEADVETV